MRPREIKDLALDVAFDRARVIWADESHPARGLILYHPMETETELLGKRAARLKGPYLVDPDPRSREMTAMSLAEKGRGLALKSGAGFLSAKLPHDPALVRGFTAAGFQAAEVTSVLEGPLPGGKDGAPPPPEPRAGGAAVRPESEDAPELLSQLGDLFYDGHHLHSPFLPDGFSRRLWRKLAEDGLRAGDPHVFARDQRQGRALGLAMGRVEGDGSLITILHVAEERRGQGLGALLLGGLFPLLAERGAAAVAAETASWNLPALGLYISLGLRPKAPLIALHAQV
jgi:ribosomal protein S18 acetylase RimI-like enzyme